MVADALSCKATPATIDCLVTDFDRMEVSYCYAGTAHVETQLILESAIVDGVWVAQQSDRLLQEVRKRLDEGKEGDFSMDDSGTFAV